VRTVWPMNAKLGAGRLSTASASNGSVLDICRLTSTWIHRWSIGGGGIGVLVVGRGEGVR